MDFEVYTKKVKVTEGDIDELNHVNNIVYLKWAQDIAGEHWYAKVSKETAESHFWVVLRHEIDYKQSLFLDDEIEVKTQILDYATVKSTRQVEFVKDNEVVATAKTLWCLLDSKTMRPKRIPEEMIRIFQA